MLELMTTGIVREGVNVVHNLRGLELYKPWSSPGSNPGRLRGRRVLYPLSHAPGLAMLLGLHLILPNTLDFFLTKKTKLFFSLETKRNKSRFFVSKDNSIASNFFAPIVFFSPFKFLLLA